MHKKILGYELGFILFPVSVIAVLGGGYIISLQLGEKIWFTPIPAIIYTLLTFILLGSLFSIWQLALAVLDDKKLSKKGYKYISIFTKIGAIVSILGIIAAFIEGYGPYSIKKYSEYIFIYVFGAPALIPYLHARHLYGNH